MKIGIEGQRLYRKKKHGMDMVALELIKNLQKIDTVNSYVVFYMIPRSKKTGKETLKIEKFSGSTLPGLTPFRNWSRALTGNAYLLSFNTKRT